MTLAATHPKATAVVPTCPQNETLRFVEEPFAGVQPPDAVAIAKALADLATAGHTVVVSDEYATEIPDADQVILSMDRRASSRFSRTVSSGKMRRPSGTCPMPRAVISCGFIVVMSLPSSRTLPCFARTIPLMVRSEVLLPAPFEPTRVTISPCSTVRLMLLRA